MNNDVKSILKAFTRKLANCHHSVRLDTVIDYLNSGRFGYIVDEKELLVVTNDFVFADDIAQLVIKLKNIFKDPHIFLKKENIVQNVSVATKMDNESRLANYKDGKYWKIKDNVPALEYVHTFVNEDDYAIYENRFLCALIDVVYDIISKKITTLCASFDTVNYNISGSKESATFSQNDYLNYLDVEVTPTLISASEPDVLVVESLIKSKKQLMFLRTTDMYKACAKAGEFNIFNTKVTNILLHDVNYNYCYNFYINYLFKQPQLATIEQMYSNFVLINIFDTLKKCGFRTEDIDSSLRVTSSVKLKFEQISLIKEPFTVSFVKVDDSHFTMTVIEDVDGSKARFDFVLFNSVEVEKTENFTSADDYAKRLLDEQDEEVIKTFLVTDLPVTADNACQIVPNQSDVYKNIRKLLGLCFMVVEGAFHIHSRYCPICGSSLVAPDGSDHYCARCEALYHLFSYGRKDLIWIKRLPKVTDEMLALVKAEKDEPAIQEEMVIGDIEEPVIEEPVVEETAETEKVIRINRSFTGKLIQTTKENQDYYVQIKNHLLSYKRVKSRISWRFDSFNLGRDKIAKIDLRGKTLVLYLALNPDEYIDTKYHAKNMGDKKKFAETPMMVKVKSERGVKFAIELIDIMLAGNPLAKEPEIVTFDEKYQTDDQLVQHGLAKYVGGGSVVVSSVTSNIDEVDKEDVDEEEIVSSEVVTEVNNPIRINRSFTGKLIQTSKENQDYYVQIKNHLLLYKRVKSRISWRFDSFNLGRDKIAKIDLRGKTLVLYLALNPDEYTDTKYHAKNMGDKKKFIETPMMVKVKSERGVKFAIELIDIMLAGNPLAKEPEIVTFNEPYRADEYLVQKGLAKYVGGGSVQVTETIVNDEVVEKEVVVTKTPIQAQKEIVKDDVVDDDEENSRINKSFEGRLIQAEDFNKQAYKSVKDCLLSFKNIHSRISWNYDSFNLGHNQIAKIALRGKTLCLFLALNPEEYIDSKYHAKDMSKVKKFIDVPTMVRIKSERAIKFACELIEILLNNVERDENYVSEVVVGKYMSDEKLIANGLAKVYDK